MVIFANVLMDTGLITSTTITALLPLAVLSAMLPIPMATPQLAGLRRQSGGPG